MPVMANTDYPGLFGLVVGLGRWHDTHSIFWSIFFFFKQKTAYEIHLTGVQTCALPILPTGRPWYRWIYRPFHRVSDLDYREGYPFLLQRHPGDDTDAGLEPRCPSPDDRYSLPEPQH